MLKKMIVVSLIGLLSNIAAFAQNGHKEAELTQKVKGEISRLGTGADARVSVKTKDGKKVKGWVSEIKTDSFVVTDEKTGAVTEVQYSQTKQAKGKNLSTGAKIAIVVGVVVGLIVVFGIIASKVD